MYYVCTVGERLEPWEYEESDYCEVLCSHAERNQFNEFFPSKARHVVACAIFVNASAFPLLDILSIDVLIIYK